METKHTAAPWHAMTMEGYPGQFILSSGTNKDTLPHTLSNLKLMTAAPELLEALQDALNDLDALSQWDSASACARKARAAIEKATQ
jgi:hypothetical protein